MRLIRYALTIVLFVATNFFAQQIAQISIPFEVYDDAGGYKDLYFGLDQTATDGIDIQLGESDLPPFPPTGAFDARWTLPENNFNGSLSSWSDYRFAPEFPYSGTKEHRLKYQSAEGATKMYFSWNLPPEVTGLLQDLANGVIVNVPISGSGVYELTNFNVINQLKLLVYYNNIVTDIHDEDTGVSAYYLEQNYPNPFNPSTKIRFEIPLLGGDERGGLVTLKVYDVLGNEVATLVNEEKLAGQYEVEFDADSYSSGIYFYELKTDKFVSVKKMLLIK